ncbi:Hypothetical_protein [Hexamita inflata]|uniref:Hypothetical_protein n=1 Tax=Hexamita inflata TaxID=28002 RepID=A0AA86TSN1_9EUKA|nr:Hypothetical protein HINF_LOCUS12947 [Hexamita inflata]
MQRTELQQRLAAQFQRRAINLVPQDVKDRIFPQLISQQDLDDAERVEIDIQKYATKKKTEPTTDQARQKLQRQMKLQEVDRVKSDIQTLSLRQKQLHRDIAKKQIIVDEQNEILTNRADEQLQFKMQNDSRKLKDVYELDSSVTFFNAKTQADLEAVIETPQTRFQLHHSRITELQKQAQEQLNYKIQKTKVEYFEVFKDFDLLTASTDTRMVQVAKLKEQVSRLKAENEAQDISCMNLEDKLNIQSIKLKELESKSIFKEKKQQVENIQYQKYEMPAQKSFLLTNIEERHAPVITMRDVHEQIQAAIQPNTDIIQFIFTLEIQLDNALVDYSQDRYQLKRIMRWKKLLEKIKNSILVEQRIIYAKDMQSLHMILSAQEMSKK